MINFAEVIRGNNGTLTRPNNSKSDRNFKNPFQSFLMAGFECADHQNLFGERHDLIKLTGHDPFINEDYLRLPEIGITSIREGIRWSFVKK